MSGIVERTAEVLQTGLFFPHGSRAASKLAHASIGKSKREDYGF
jgi:hypothetical protein